MVLSPCGVKNKQKGESDCTLRLVAKICGGEALFVKADNCSVYGKS